MDTKTLRRLVETTTLAFILTSCASLTENRSFVDQMDRNSDGLFVPGRDFRVVPGDSGHAYRSPEEIMERTPASYRSKDQILEQRSLMTELQQREQALNHMERQEYLRAQEFLESESERLYYLSLSTQDRRHYIQARSYGSPGPSEQISVGHSQFFRETGGYHQSRLGLGMSKQDVTQAWGQPSRVEVAGNPRHENERWAYIEGRQVRYIYFENGRVNGWTLD